MRERSFTDLISGPDATAPFRGNTADRGPTPVPSHRPLARAHTPWTLKHAALKPLAGARVLHSRHTVSVQAQPSRCAGQSTHASGLHDVNDVVCCLVSYRTW